MRRGFALVLASALLCAAGASCAELRIADDPGGGDASELEDGGSTPEEGDSAVLDDGAPTDAKVKPADSAPPVCDGPCPPEALATNLSQATSIVVDDTNIYFAQEGGSGNGTVFQCPKTGCNGPPIKLGPGYATAIALDAQRVYWGDFTAGKLVSCAIGGCSESPKLEAANQTQIRGVSTDGVDLFWSTSDNGGSIMRCVRGACAPTAVRTGQGSVIDVAADQTRVFWGNIGAKVVNGCVASSCASPLTLGPGSSDVSVHAGRVHWVNAQAKNVVSCSGAGCNGSPITLGSSQSPSHPVSDGQHIYWRDQLYNEIYRCPASGCAPGPVIIAKQQRGQPGGQIALDGQYVYWTTSSGVYRLRK